MNIAIIGAGFYGCYIAKKLNQYNPKNKIDIYEKNYDILLEATRNNQCRLHKGFHYPRSIKTIKQTIEGSEFFLKEFKKFIFYPKINLYAIHKQSFVSFDDYINIYKKLKLNFSIEKIDKFNYFKDISKIQGVINVREGVILLEKLLAYLKKEIYSFATIKLNNKVTYLDEKNGRIISNNLEKNIKYDYIINTTYTNPNLGQSKKNNLKLKYELAALVLCNNIYKKPTAITIMDGNHVSLYPINKKISSLSSVKYTPFKKFSNLSNMLSYYKKVKMNKLLIRKIQSNILNHFSQEININLKKLCIRDITIAPKAKLFNDIGDTRETLFIKNNKIISILCGKLDAAPIVWHNIKKYFT